MQVICARNCGFRVDSGYFRRKPKFTPGICPRCAGPIQVVNDYTDTKTKGYAMDVDPRSATYGSIISSTGEVDPAADETPAVPS